MKVSNDETEFIILANNGLLKTANFKISKSLKMKAVNM